LKGEFVAKPWRRGQSASGQARCVGLERIQQLVLHEGLSWRRGRPTLEFDPHGTASDQHGRQETIEAAVRLPRAYWLRMPVTRR
jgi:hypothetical protein